MTEKPKAAKHRDLPNLHYQFPLKDRDARSKELILYIAHECVDDPRFTKLKLFKILFYSDFESYGRYRVPITGMPYRKAPFGPAPATYTQLEAEMIRDRQISIVTRRVYDHSSQRLFPLQEPTFDFLSARDIAIVNGWIRHFWGWTARRVSEYSHGKAWKVAGESELIPYESVFISDEPVTFEDVARAKELAAKYGWKL
ncbi:MAG: Panacea domain-containing protein [Bryobacteraceae bacterium]